MKVVDASRPAFHGYLNALFDSESAPAQKVGGEFHKIEERSFVAIVET